MTVLVFKHEGWFVATAAWSAAAKPGDKVQICYQWGANWISLIDSATGIARVTINMEMDDFAKRIAKGDPVVDLTRFVE